ncbi:MAG: hypothetical protein ABJF10_09645 [Chthoniobacter sp.]|uniref:hypothetical protein n=1 Tax=Chthoniobacter sp. TaxID=2510640 RepID=UPI0032A8314B
MNWPLFFQLLVTAIVAFGGAWLAHLFSAKRDYANSRRAQRIAFLIDAYRRIESAANRLEASDPSLLESPIADIQLFGTSHQVALAQDLAESFASRKSASADALLKSLRQDLRAQLGLEAVPDCLLHLRYYPHPRGGAPTLNEDL